MFIHQHSWVTIIEHWKLTISILEGMWATPLLPVISSGVLVSLINDVTCSANMSFQSLWSHNIRRHTVYVPLRYVGNTASMKSRNFSHEQLMRWRHILWIWVVDLLTFSHGGNQNKQGGSGAWLYLSMQVRKCQLLFLSFIYAWVLVNQFLFFSLLFFHFLYNNYAQPILDLNLARRTHFHDDFLICFWC